MGKPSFAAEIDKIMENPNNGGVPRSTKNEEWRHAMVQWGKAVRRDILVLEYHLKHNFKVNPKEFYGDPGDPGDPPLPPPDDS